MKLVKSASVVISTVMFLGACSAHSPMILQSTTDSTPPESQHAPTTEQIFITAQSLPPSVEYERISQIDYGKAWYGGSTDAYAAMAKRARELGANALIEARTWYQPSGFSWAAPHGTGLAVRIKDINQLKAANIAGDWY